MPISTLPFNPSPRAANPGAFRAQGGEWMMPAAPALMPGGFRSGSGYGQTAPMLPMPPVPEAPAVPASRPAPVMPSMPMLVRSGAKTMNANQSGVLSDRGTAGAQSGPLSLRRPVPVGRSMRDHPERRLETAARRGSLGAAMMLTRMADNERDRQFQIGRDQAQQQFYRERDAARMAPPAAMPSPPEPAPPPLATPEPPAVDPGFAGPSPLDSGRSLLPPTMVPQDQWNPQVHGTAPAGMFAMGAPVVGAVPIPGTDQMQPFQMGQPKGTPVPKAQPLKPAEAPKIPEGIQYEKDALGRIIGGVYPTYNDQGKLVMRRIDLDGDGVVSPQEQAAAMQAAGQTPGGVKFSRVQ